MDIREYNITYISKEFLAKNGWKIVAYNPPGSQGTFTIPNPDKDGTYKGQTGSLSPDIIAFKFIDGTNIFLIVEAKPTYNASDVKKMITMFENKNRRSVFFQIVKSFCEANDIEYDTSKKTEIHFAKAHGGDTHPDLNVSTILITQINEWDTKIIDPTKDIYSNFKIEISGPLLKY